MSLVRVRGTDVSFAELVASEAATLLAGVVEVSVADPSTEPPQAGVPVDARGFLRGSGLPPGTVTVLDAPLSAPLIRSAMGWTDRRSRTAVVSSLAVGEPRRLGALVAHEAVHVLGFGHCRRPACVAHQVAVPEDLDLVTGLCERCRRRIGARSTSGR